MRDLRQVDFPQNPIDHEQAAVLCNLHNQPLLPRLKADHSGLENYCPVCQAELEFSEARRLHRRHLVSAVFLFPVWFPAKTALLAFKSAAVGIVLGLGLTLSLQTLAAVGRAFFPFFLGPDVVGERSLSIMVAAGIGYAMVCLYKAWTTREKAPQLRDFTKLAFVSAQYHKAEVEKYLYEAVVVE